MASELRNEVNRTSFAKADDEYGDEAMGKTLGMLGKTGSGKLRVMKKEQRQSKSRSPGNGNMHSLQPYERSGTRHREGCIGRRGDQRRLDRAMSGDHQ